MKFFIYIYIITCLIFVFLFYFLIRRQRLKIQQQVNKKIRQELESSNSNFNAQKREKETIIQSLDKEISQKQEFNTQLLQIRQTELENLLNEKKIQAEEKISNEIEEWSQSAQEAANEVQREYRAQLQLKTDSVQDQLNLLQLQLTEYQKQRDTINQEILRRRAIEEKTDFYRVCIDDASKNDIQILNEIKSRLSKVDLLSKLVYDNYIAKPSKEMVKRVLEGRDPSGIYKITNIQTNEIYIGKSKTISTRWINHIKSAYGLEGVADSQFQRALKKYGVDNFTWELLEECPADKLTTQEKHWIEFYDTTHYGYNLRKG